MEGKKMIKKVGQILVLAMMIIVLAGQGWGDFLPVLINFQGRLTDRDKNALTGAHTVKFDLYQTAGDTNSLWTKTIDVVASDNGVFNALLGPLVTLLQGTLTIDPATINWKENYWMGISVDGAEELSPRQPLVYVPYAITAYQSIFADQLSPGNKVINGVTFVRGLWVAPPLP
jgi:hypothetical protein